MIENVGEPPAPTMIVCTGFKANVSMSSASETAGVKTPDGSFVVDTVTVVAAAAPKGRNSSHRASPSNVIVWADVVTEITCEYAMRATVALAPDYGCEPGVGKKE
jgi:hypothetical protein